MAHLWPEADPERARHSLDDALSALRRELRSDALFLGVASLSLNPEVLENDLADYASALRDGDAERAVALYAGPFLDGFFVPDAGEFERWVEAERGRRSQAHARVLDSLASDSTARGDFAAAVRWCQARVGTDPLDTPATVRLLGALMSAGSQAEALRVARVHEALLREELDSAPGGEWDAVVAGLRADRPAVLRPTTVATVAQPAPPVYSPTTDRISDVAPVPVERRSWMSPIIVAGVLLVIAFGGYAVWRGRSTSTMSAAAAVPSRPVAPRTSIAVLPFAHVGGGVTDEPFVDGLTDELISALGKQPGIRVTGRTSAFAIKDRGLNVRTIADTLGVGTVLEGSVRRAGDQLRVSVQLVSAADNTVLWTETYDRKLADVFAVQSEIAHAIAGALLPKLGKPAVSLGSVRVRDLATYELYLKGRYFWGRRTRGDLRRAVDYFEQAVARDPTYAQAYAGLADARILLIILGDSPPTEQLPLARQAAAAALRIDSTLAEAHAALGNIYEAFDWDSRGADRELARAVELDPGYATAQLYHGIHLLNRGQFDDAVATLERARTLDPLASAVRMQLGRAYVSVHKPDLALPLLRSALELTPEFTAAYLHIGDAYLQKRDPVSALVAYRRAAELNGGRDSAQIAYGLAATGQRDEAVRLLTAFVGAPKHRYLPPVPVAKAYVAIGDANAAFRWLERGFEERAAQMRTIKVTPGFNPLHSDPRWAILLRRMNVEP
jgi:TolB-like protein/DNA-binding SARP family transcriptional activator